MKKQFVLLLAFCCVFLNAPQAQSWYPIGNGMDDDVYSL